MYEYEFHMKSALDVVSSSKDRILMSRFDTHTRTTTTT